MRASERDRLTLGVLAAMPFLDRLELTAVSGMNDQSVHSSLSRLQAQGLAACLRHGSPLTDSTCRWHVTAEGLRRLTLENGTSPDQLLRTHPVSAHWQRLLLARLDAVAVIYRLASSAGRPYQFRWYRSAALDAAMMLPGGKTCGVIRQGATTDRTAFSDRVRWLAAHQGALPRALLALMPDEVRLRQARKLLSHYPGPVFLAMEQDVAYADSDDVVWRITSTDAVLSLNEVLTHIRPGGRLPVEPPLTRKTPPTDLTVREEPEGVSDHLLSAVLIPADKRMLDHLADWPWIAPSDLGGLTGLSRSGVSRLTSRLGRLGLVCAVSLSGQRRLALSHRGLALLARRDRASVSVTIRRWPLSRRIPAR